MSEKQIGIWVRVSDVKQVEKESHIIHEVRAKDFVKSRNWTAVKTYRLEAMSGKSIMSYTQTKQMLHDVRTGVITGLVFSKIARLARNTKELIEISEIFREHNADLISMDMSIDTSTPIGRHFFRQMSSMAEWEREMIVDRLKCSIHTRMMLGKHVGGQAPIGYKYIDKELEIREDEAVICRLIFELFIKHQRKRTIARILNEKGYRTRLGKPFSGIAIRRTLQDPIYKGLRRMNYTSRTNDGKRSLKPESEWIFHKVPAIVSEETWDRVNDILTKQAKSYKQPLNAKVRLFTGFVFCKCGGKMVTRNTSKNYICLDKCGNKIHKEDLEEVFKSELHSYTVSQSKAENYLQKMDDVIANKRQRLDVLLKEKTKIDIQLKKLIELHSIGQIETDAFKGYHDEPYQRLTQVKETIAEIEGEVSAFSDQENMTQLILEEARNLYEKWNELEHTQKRTIIETVTENIVISDDEIVINLYKIMPDARIPSSLELTTNGEHNPWGF